MKIKIYLCLLFGLLSSSIIYAQDEETLISPTIVGGNYVELETYPWVAELLNDDNEHICAGTLIAPQWILTAAHCGNGFEGLVDLPTKVIINSVNYTQLTPGSEEIEIEAIYVHEDFNISTPFNDIALIKLANPSSITPVNYDGQFNDFSNISNNDLTTVLGWGSTNEEGDISYILKEAQPKVLYNDEMIIYAGYQEGETPAGAGAGDSGGPMIIQEDDNWKQIGVISGGSEIITTVESPGRYTKIFYFKDWIKSVIENSVALDENSIPISLSVYNDRILLGGNNDENIHYEIYDISGKLLQTGTAFSTINLSQQIRGFVFLKLQSQEQTKVFKLKM